ncbi:copper amine oxidase N-terminal domain-containing protein [bacterium]|nr:MAG: copper amine oxidase N-terminal domain-containing protein [bacterium]
MLTLLVAVAVLQTGPKPILLERPATVIVNGTKVPGALMIRENRVQIQMRPIFEALGAFVQWFPENRKVVATKGDKEVSLIIGQNFAYKMKPHLLDYPPRIVNGRVMVPLRFVSETLGASVEWYRDTKIARVDLSSTTSGEPG